jgi:hypothetical protein
MPRSRAIPPDHEQPPLSELANWWTEQHAQVDADTPDELAADQVGLGAFAIGRLSRAASSTEAAAAIGTLTREQLEAAVLASVFERRRQALPEGYMRWGGVPC